MLPYPLLKACPSGEDMRIMIRTLDAMEYLQDVDLPDSPEYVRERVPSLWMTNPFRWSRLEDPIPIFRRTYRRAGEYKDYRTGMEIPIYEEVE